MISSSVRCWRMQPAAFLTFLRLTGADSPGMQRPKGIIIHTTPCFPQTLYPRNIASNISIASSGLWCLSNPYDPRRVDMILCSTAITVTTTRVLRSLPMRLHNRSPSYQYNTNPHLAHHIASRDPLASIHPRIPREKVFYHRR